MNLDENITAVLRDHADRPVDADALLAGALTGGRARQRRNHRLTALAGAGVAGVTAATLLTAPLVMRGGGSSGDGAGVSGRLPAPPPAEGEPGLAERPALVGTDPTVLRFAVPSTPYRTVGVGWSSIDGLERFDLSLDMPSTDERVENMVMTTVMAKRGPLPPADGDDPATANTTTAVTVDGRPATIEREPASGGAATWLTWEPADGVRMRIGPGTIAMTREIPGGAIPTTEPEYEEIPALDDDELIRFAESIDLDSTTRCTAPIRLESVPSDARLAGCSSGMHAGGGEHTTFHSRLDFVNDTGSQFAVWVTAPAYPSPSPEEPGPTGTVGWPDSTVDPSGSADVDPSGSADVDPSVDPSGSDGADPSGTPGIGNYSPDVSLNFDRPSLFGSAWGVGEYDRARLEAIVDGVRIVGDVTDPTTWPAKPIP
jgi:hypothetical protein